MVIDNCGGKGSGVPGPCKGAASIKASKDIVAKVSAKLRKAQAEVRKIANELKSAKGNVGKVKAAVEKAVKDKAARVAKSRAKWSDKPPANFAEDWSIPA